MEQPDIEIGAVVKAKRLRFNSKPKTDVHVRGEPGAEGGSGSVRENLPETVEPGVTYRDVRVAWLAAGRLDPSGQKQPQETDEAQRDGTQGRQQ